MAVDPRFEVSNVRSMNRPGLSLQVASATLFLLLAVLARSAENVVPPAAKAAAPTVGDSPADRLKRFDKDGDGLLDDEERAAAKQALMKAQGTSQADGAAAPVLPADAFRRRMLELFDIDNDGRLDEAERADAQRFAAENGLKPGGDFREAILKRFDKNGDGRLDADERAALQKSVRERAAAAPKPTPAVNQAAALEKVLRSAVEGDAAQRARFDANKDGKLDDAEWATARGAIQRAVTDGAGAAAKTTTPADDKKRTDDLARELARRRQKAAGDPK
jgi:hypothetical protein